MRKIYFFLVLLCAGKMGVGQVYQQDFGTVAITTKPFTGTPPVFDANLSSSSWTTSAAAFGGLAGSAGASVSLSNSSGTPTFTLTFNVASGFKLDVTSFNFWRVRSATGAANWAMTINGINVGSGTIPTTGAALGTTNVSNTVSGLTGTITVVLTFSGASGTGTCRVDDFTLNGSVTAIPTPTTTALTPNSATAGGGGFTLTVDGTNFLNGFSTVRWNGSNRTTTFVNSTQLTAAINAADIAAAGTASVDVLNTGNPTASNAQTFTINSAVAPTVVTSVSSLSSFGTVTSGTNGPERTYDVSGSNLTSNIVVTAPSGVEISLTSGSYTGTTGNTINLSPTAGNVATTSIFARYSPATPSGSFSANITNASTGATQRDVAVSGKAIDAEPTTQSAITFGTITNNSIVVNFSGGNGAKRVLVARQGSAVNSDPVDGTTYTDGSNVFAAGTQIGAGNYVVYAGTGNTATVTGLAGGTTYHFAVYEYNDNSTSGAENYLVTSPGVNNTTTSVPTFTWIGGNGTWGTAANWSPARTTPGTSDILQFNDGTTVTVTGVPAQTIGQLLISNSTVVNLQAGAAGTLVIGGLSGTDLSVGSGSQLNIDGTNALTINLSAGTVGSVSGSITLSNAAHKITAADANGLTFQNGSVFTAGTGFSSSPFGTAGTGNSVVFTNGSTYIQQAGSNPFVLTQPASLVVFQSGSLFKLQANLTPSLSGRTYGNFELDFGAAIISGSGANALTMDNLTVTQGSLTLGITGGLNVKGNISVASGATLSLSPASVAALTLNGSTAQSISNSGTLTFGTNQSLTINNVNGVTLNTSIALGSAATLTLTNGKVTLGANNLSASTVTGGTSASYIVTNGTGALTINNVGALTVTFPVGPSTSLYHPATINNAGTADNFSVKVSSSVAPCAPAATSVNATWDIAEAVAGGSNCTITLDYAGATTGVSYSASGAQVTHCAGAVSDYHNGTVTGTVASGSGFTNFSPFTVSNDLTVLPVSFGTVKAYQQNTVIKVEWTNLTESDMNGYVIERSADGRSFSAIGTVGARLNNGGKADYSFTDAAPLTGLNFYRIKAAEINGTAKLSTIVKVDTRAGNTDIVIYPNPVTNGQVALQASSLPKGVYTVRIFNANGQQVQSQVINHNGGSVTQAIALPATIKSGIYSLQVSGADLNMTKTFIVK